MFETCAFCTVFSSNVWQRSVNVKLTLVQVLTHHALWHIHQYLHEGWSYLSLLYFKQPIITIFALALFSTWHSMQFTCASTLNIIDFVYFFYRHNAQARLLPLVLREVSYIPSHVTLLPSSSHDLWEKESHAYTQCFIPTFCSNFQFVTLDMFVCKAHKGIKDVVDVTR